MRLANNVELFAAVDKSLGAEVPDGIMNYDDVRGASRTWPSRPHAPLLETLLNKL